MDSRARGRNGKERTGTRISRYLERSHYVSGAVVILAIDGERVDSPESLNAQVKARWGREMTLTVDRDGQRIEKKVTPAL